MTFTDIGFSTVRQWLVGKAPTAPSGMLVGVGSGAVAFTNLLLGSPLDPTRRGFESQSGIGFTAQFEYLVQSGDITTGSLVREIGLIAQSGGNVFFRALQPEIELNGSVFIDNFLTIKIS